MFSFVSWISESEAGQMSAAQSTTKTPVVNQDFHILQLALRQPWVNDTARPDEENQVKL